MKKRNIIVIGASTGGFEAFRKIIAVLPPDFDASIFIVWHMSPNVRGVLPTVLNKVNDIFASHAYDGEEILPNRIYIAPPDHHLLIEEGKVRVTHGPKENRFRPAVDPLFRSAAYSYGDRVIGVILSGALDDGTAGLWTVKHYGGIAVVQDPKDAEVPSMPENALEQVQVDYCVSIDKMGELLTRLANETLTQNVQIMKDEQTKKEIRVAEEDGSFNLGLFNMGELTPFTCPECHGVLAKFRNGTLPRFRCHTGHAYSVDTLMTAVTENIENSLYSAVRGIEEGIMLLNHIGDHFAEANNPKLASLYFKKAKEAESRANGVRQAVLEHEPLSKDKLQQEAEEHEYEK
jgi:two-component system chemotaxis response regulator CheB